MCTKSAENYRVKAIEEINELRQRHNACPLVEDSEIDKYAQQWAEYMAATGKFHHRKDGVYGENLYAGSDCLAEKAIQTWYNESKKYSYSRPGFSSATGHFTQLVWKSSKKIGIGIASSGGMTYIVANFYPPGNYMGEFEENVS